MLLQAFLTTKPSITVQAFDMMHFRTCRRVVAARAFASFTFVVPTVAITLIAMLTPVTDAQEPRHTSYNIEMPGVQQQM